MRRLGAAIVGTGFIGAVHARSARLAGGRLVGVSASTPARSLAAAQRLGAERAYADVAELVADPEVDVVHVCTPNDVHVEAALLALAAGKHVVCEKPLAVDAHGAAELLAAARAADRVAAVPFVYRYYPMVREARARVAAGEIGSVALGHGTYLQDWLLDPEDSNWRVEAGRGGRSRAFADVGSHWCDLFEFVSGRRIVAVTAELRTMHERRERPRDAAPTFGAAGGDGVAGVPVETEDLALVLLRTEDEAVASVVVSQVAAGHKNRLSLELSGPEGSVAFDQQTPDVLKLGRADGVTTLERDPRRLAPDAARYAVLPAGHPQGYHECFEAFVADVYDAIRGATPSVGLPTFADGARAVAIVEAVLASAAADGAWAPVQEVHGAVAVDA